MRARPKPLVTVESKIRKIAGLVDGFKYMFGDYSQANVDLSRIDSPTILYILPPAGTLNLRNEVVRDNPTTMIWFVCPSQLDFDGAENDNLIEKMKRGAMKFIEKLNESKEFAYIEGDIPYQVAYDIFDDGLTGIGIDVTLNEINGVPLCTDLYKREEE